MAYTDNLLLQNSITTLNGNNMDIMQIADMDIKPACYAIAGKALSTNGTDSVVYVNKIW
jgi:hypothetical protein